MSEAGVETKVDSIRTALSKVRAEIARAIVGHEKVVEDILVCLLSGGHALVEGVPGLGKTYLIKTLGDVLDLDTSRIQFTPDLMPADILGTNVLVSDEGGGRVITFQKGPVFAHIVLADEINRATPKTQAALLEAMQERNVTLGGVRYPLDAPFIVMATQNPIEMEGTYPLPEAQLDRFFFKLKVDYPSAENISTIIDRTTQRELPAPERTLGREDVLEMQGLVREIPIADAVKSFAVRTVLATHPDRKENSEQVRRYVRYGASPRGAQSLVLAGKVYALMEGRYNVSFEDVRKAALPALRHRIIMSFEGEAEGVSPDDIILNILERTPEV